MRHWVFVSFYLCLRVFVISQNKLFHAVADGIHEARPFEVICRFERPCLPSPLLYNRMTENKNVRLPVIQQRTSHKKPHMHKDKSRFRLLSLCFVFVFASPDKCGYNLVFGLLPYRTCPFPPSVFPFTCLELPPRRRPSCRCRRD